MDMVIHNMLPTWANGAHTLAPPAEGLWSIGTAWQDDWPAQWCHGVPNHMETSGPWTILTGDVVTLAGTWKMRDCWRPEASGWRCVRTWRWTGEHPANPITLTARFRVVAAGNRVVIPGCLYYGNPSGAVSDKTPVYDGNTGAQAIFEEHRLPMPFVVAEVKSGAATAPTALHTSPSPVPYANLPDQWWSIGVEAYADATELILLSGPCACNGRRSVVKARQDGLAAYSDAFLDVPAGAVIRKEFFLEIGMPVPHGSGFKQAVTTSLRRHEPFSLEGLPDFGEIVRAKARYALTRWLEGEDYAGFSKFPDRPFIVIGWCGQAASPGYSLPVLAPMLGDASLCCRAQKALDFLSTATFHEGGFHTWFNVAERRWEKTEVLSEGQGMLSMFRALAATGRTGLDGTRWRGFLGHACGLHAQRILADDWCPTSTSEAFLVAPLCEGARQLGHEAARQAALKAGHHYRERHLDMLEPYWGGTLDARCEDKEAAIAALQAFLALHDLTGDPEWLAPAEHALDVTLTYCVVWDVPLPPGPLADLGLRTRGWTSVSVQNMHLDVFGVLIAPDVYRMGELANRQDLKSLAKVMFRSCGQLIDAHGSQGEQIEQTNYTQQRREFGVTGMRGGYSENWTVFWITAHFLNAAARFTEMGVTP